MGAWDASNFGNDDACDWASDLSNYTDFSYVESTLDAVLGAADSVSTRHGCEGLAAAEVVARSLGNWGLRDEYSEEVDRWVERTQRTPSTALVDKALLAIDRITSPTSSLAELWEEDEEWLGEVADLRQRLRNPG